MSAEEQAIHARIAVVESQLGDLRGDNERFERHVTALYGKIEKLTWLLLTTLGAVVAQLIVSLAKG